MKNNGSPSPEFHTDEDRSFFHVVLPIHDAFLAPTKVRRKTDTSSEKTPDMPLISSEKIVEQFGENAYNLLLIIREDVTVSASDIAQKIQLSSRGVEKIIAKLKAARVLDRIGPDKGGTWKLLVKIKQ